MNTKTFAQEARKILMRGVAKQLLYWGFTEKGDLLEQPQKVSGGYIFRGQAFDDASVPALWHALAKAIDKKGVEAVVEEAAYTWFNRIMALRILAKNGYEEPQLENTPGLEHTPLLLQRARQGKYSFLKAEEQVRLQKILTDYSKDQEIFALLLKGYCHSHPTLQRVFGRIDDYTELLLPDNMLQNDGFLHLLNTTDAIADEDYQKVELIGWLYQFYISEKKDEVFASFKKNKKAEAKDIPAATQIFTPNWIVKYMVENTAGKIWLDKNPNSPLKDSMKYLVDGSRHSELVSESQNSNDTEATERSRSVLELQNVSSSAERIENSENASQNIVSSSAKRIENTPIINSVEDLTLIDPACGSGHILVEGFSLIYQMYMEEYYEPEEAVEAIFKNNLFGLDIDDRAAQLANFAILLKAAKVYPKVWETTWLPNVHAMPEAENFSYEEIRDFLGEQGEVYTDELATALQIMKEAKNLGSVMQFNLSTEARDFITKRYVTLTKQEFIDFNLEAILQKAKAYIPVLLALTKKYTSVVANPPYMGQKSMNADLKNYVNTHYPTTKSDLMTIFMEVIPNMTKDNSRFALINLPSWLFLSSFEKIRKNYLDNFTFDSLLHMGRGIFGIDFGSVAFAIKKTKSENALGSYFRLHERNFQHIQYKDIEKLFLYSNGKEKYKYDFNLYRGEEGITEIPKNGTLDGKKLFYPNIPQTNFSKIPGSPIAYWVSENIYNQFKNEKLLNDTGNAVKGLDTCNNERFVRLWHEVVKNKISFFSKGDNTDYKWFPYLKGGGQKKWYGYFDEIVLWENNGDEIKNYRNPDGSIKSRPQNIKYYFKKGITWSSISSGSFAVRFMNNSIFGGGGSALFTKSIIDEYLMGLLNSKIVSYFLLVFNPTFNFLVGDLKKIPILHFKENWVKGLVVKNINVSKKDWDSKETSWDFEQSPLLNNQTNLEASYKAWQKNVTKDFFQLHANEEELNRIFIDIYGLQEELTPEVALKDITILQEELNAKDLEKLEVTFKEQGAEAIALPINKAEVIAQFISYAMGVFMGRYRLDKPGLNIAHPNPTKEELASYSYNEQEIIIDEDAIIPIMGTACNFPDDALQQINHLLDTLWGAETRIENSNFIQDCLNKDLEKYLVKDFYKDHCSRYKKKPIYWLFSSPKGAFQVLVYMHRMNAFTVEKIRANYLLEHINHITSEITVLEKNSANLSTAENKKLDLLRKQLIECENYDVELKDMADAQIVLDLDDGVTVNYKKFETVVAKIK
ncbi:BREX-1 system adenine-specific DNA-methyltransferase PglX [Wenyingzhuangia marina]|uniref:site-specific DNA-methyltransferase (adenine-specific) n=1 Tax=Wenyingzhuangia marina TaxID=1195760 RepID=A0A1M5S6M9_9FLAO|nr:BREX-1 system adenine-specific DNA-methyltransferase PglX [Wenyingzhuangia marina]GGF79093.1 type II deoxyribonuclease [Wenyingzhuangia marina]SHH34149.1 N-6 DNA Methylase [Wenyingzhuangia marina]